MIKRDITETIYEYDCDGHLLKKTVTTTHEEEGCETNISYQHSLSDMYNLVSEPLTATLSDPTHITTTVTSTL